MIAAVLANRRKLPARNTLIAGPPFDIDADRLKKARLQRLAKAMNLQSHLKTYLKSKRKYDDDPEVKANDSFPDSA
jgi:hypothetical protein